MNRQKKEQLMNKVNIDGCLTTRTITTANEFGSLSTTFTPATNTFDPYAIIKQSQALMAQPQQENKMYFCEDTPDYQARNHLHHRASKAMRDHEEKLRGHFYLDGTDTSKWSQEDAVQALKDGMFVFYNKEEAKKPRSFVYYGFGVNFRDPAKPENREGYNEALKKTTEHFETAIDFITVLDPKESLKKVDEFRNKTFH